MQILLHTVVPHPMQGAVNKSDVWLRECVFESGQLYHIVAPSGTGKTSLLHILYGIRHDYSGIVTFNDENIQSYTHSKWCELRTNSVSMVFQGLRLFPELDIMENITIKQKRTNHTPRMSISSMLDALGMMPHIHKKAGVLSYGQQQRVAIVRALCQPFKILLLDEPFSHLDTENAQAALDCIMQEVEKQQATCIITSLQSQPFQQHMHVYHL